MGLYLLGPQGAESWMAVPLGQRDIGGSPQGSDLTLVSSLLWMKFREVY